MLAAQNQSATVSSSLVPGARVSFLALLGLVAAGSRENLHAAAGFGCQTDIHSGSDRSYIGGWDIFTKLEFLAAAFYTPWRPRTRERFSLVAIAHAF